jgi:hypothetical protein
MLSAAFWRDVRDSGAGSATGIRLKPAIETGRKTINCGSIDD